MAQYKYNEFFKPNEHPNFDTLRDPGTPAPDPGIYRCKTCGREIGVSQGHLLPAHSHHAHPAEAGPILWQLMVAPDY